MTGLNYLQFAIRTVKSIQETLGGDGETRGRKVRALGMLDILLRELEDGINVVKQEEEMRGELVNMVKEYQSKEEGEA